MKKSVQLEDIFSVNGGLSASINGFMPRAEQTKMAIAVQSAIKQQSPLIIEAGTGTGKTFAYLVPLLLAKQKTIISTGSKNLQDQLFNRDLPTIQKALSYAGKIALLKGRGNYLCLERFNKLLMQGIIGDRSILADFSTAQEWLKATQTGDLTECAGLPENSPILPQLTSTTENCLGTECSYYTECYIVKARKRALEADLLVVNHHLFFADMAVKESGFGELIPQAEVIVFDEAHQIPDIASQYFSQSISSKQLIDLCKDIILIYHTELKDMSQLNVAAEHFEKAIQDFRLLISEGNSRGNWRELLQSKSKLSYAIKQGLDTVLQKLDFILQVAKLALGRSQSLDAMHERISLFQRRLTSLKETTVKGYCYWYETLGKHFYLHITPLDVADKFSIEMDKKKCAWIFTSATLEVNGDFTHFCQRLGIKNSQQSILPSPFNYAKQALLCVPRYLPANPLQNTKQLGELLLPIIHANKGRCFVLCTSYSMMNALASYFRENSELSVLLQGETTKSRLLAQFTEQKNNVLVATSSFWEGVDVRGDALSLVIIDKLPFNAPDEPLLKARIEACSLQGGNPFKEIQIPEAVISLKQGVGRLIRDFSDKGAIIICDGRLVMRDYGEIFLNSLPNAMRTRDTKKVIEFLYSKESQ